jgi:hypothetical protein
MQILFDISALGFIIYGIVTLFRRTLPAAIEPPYARKLLQFLALGIVTKALVILMWYVAAGGQEVNDSLLDIISYDAYGRMVADYLRHFELPPLIVEEFAYFSYIVGFCYAIFGEYHIVVSIYNMIVTILIAIMVFHIAYKVTGNRSVSMYAYVLVMFYPHFMSASYYILKDVSVAFAVVGAAWSLYCRKTFRGILISFLIFTLMLIYLRAPLGVMVLILGFVQLYINTFSKDDRRHYLKKVFFVGSVILIATFTLHNVNVADKPLSDFGYTIQEVEQETGGEPLRFEFTLGTMTDILHLLVSHPFLFLKNLVIATIRTFYGPFFLYAQTGPTLQPYDPSEVGFRAVLEATSGMLTGLLMPMIIYGFYSCVRFTGRRTFLLWSFVLIQLILLVWAGIILRWRLPLIPMVMIFAGIGLLNYAAKLKRFYTLYVILFVLGATINVTWEQHFLIAKYVVCLLTIFIGFFLIKFKFKSWIQRNFT